MTNPPLSPGDYLKQRLAAEGTKLPQQQSALSPGDYLRQQLSSDKSQEPSVTDNGNEPDDNGFIHTIGSFIDYLGNVGSKSNLFPASLTDPNFIQKNDAAIQQRQEAAKQVGSNIAKDVSTAYQYYKNKIGSLSGWGQIFDDAKDLYSTTAQEASQSDNPISTMASGLFKGFVQKPVEALTYTVNDNGTAKPATVDQEAQSLQAAAGLVAQIGAFKALNASFLGDIPKTIDGALEGLQPTKLGPITLSGGFKQGAKYIASETGAGALAGGIQGAIAGTGQDNQPEQILSGALSFAPFTAALSMLGVKKYVGDLQANKIKLMDVANDNSIPNIAATNALRINPSDDINTLARNVDAVASGDNLVKAAINSRLKVGDGYIVEGITPEFGKSLEEGTNPSVATYPENYVPPKLLNKATFRPRPNGTEIKFLSPFDRLAYFAAGRKINKDTQSLIDDAINQTGLTQDEIISHGKYVRMQSRLAAKTSPLIPRTQPEIDAYNQESLENGQAIINRMAEGGKVKDGLGSVWVKQGDMLTDGKQILPINEATTAQRIGRKANDSPFYQPYLQIGQQEFNPNFGRVASNIPVKYHYSDNGNLLVTPVKYTDDALKFFKRTGFMKNEIVSYNGMDHTIIGDWQSRQLSLKNNTTGEFENVYPNYVRRTNHSLTPEIIQGVGVKAPTLNPESILNNLYSKMWTNFKSTLKEPEVDPQTGLPVETEEVPFGKFLEKFYSENRIPQKDQSYISSIFTKKLSDDLANTTLSPEELSIRNEMMNKFKGVRQDHIDDYSHFLSNQAESNNLFYSPEGGGKYRIRSQDNGETLGIVGSVDEAQDLINKIRQSRGLDKDGGFTGSIPPGTGNLGGLANPFTPDDPSGLENRIDLSRMGGLLSKFSPVSHVLQSADNVASKFGLKTSFFPLFTDLQHKLIERHNLISSNPQIKQIAGDLQKTLDFGARLSSKRRIELADYLDAMNIDDIKNRFLARPMNGLEDNMAKELAKSDVGAIQKLLFDTKLASPNTSVGSDAFIDTMIDIANVKDPKTLNNAKDFARAIKTLDQDTFSGDAVLRLAHAYEDPASALSQAEMGRKINVTPSELIYLNKVNTNFGQLANLMDIDPAARFQMYLPSIVRQFASGYGNGAIPEGFAREMARVGITPKNVLLRDPNKLLVKYFVASLNEKSGFNEALTKFQNGVNTNTQLLLNKPELTRTGGTFAAKMNDYINQVRGYKTVDDNLWNAIKEVAGNLGIKTFDTNSILNLASLGSIAGRPALAARDYLNAIMQTNNHFGPELTKEVFSKSISPKNLRWMKDNNILADKSSAQIIDPGADESVMLNTNSAIRNWSTNAFNISGQEFVYEHTAAGIYQGSMNLAEKYFKQLQDKKITKGQAFDKLGITSNYGNGLISQINDHLVNGRPDLAAKLYSESNMRLLSAIYGFHNNPIGWNTTFGRLMSQWGSWSANASQGMIDLASRGNKWQISKKIARAGVSNLALVLAGQKLGFNLLSWTVDNPMNVWPTTGPLAGLSGTMADDYNRGRGMGSILWNEGMGFVPYARAFHDWYQGLQMVGYGNIITGLGRTSGMPILSSETP